MPEWFSIIDLSVMAVLLLFALGGFQKGVAGQLSHLLTGVVFGLLLFFVYPHLYGWASGTFSKLSDRALMWSLVGLFFGAGLLFYVLVNQLLVIFLKLSMSDSADHLVGMVLGFVRGGFMILFIMLFSTMLGPVKVYEVLSKQSVCGRFVCYEVVPRVQPHMTRSELERKIRKISSGLRNHSEAGDVGF